MIKLHNVTLKDKNVLVTGGLGFLGSSLSVACVNLGAHVTIIDNLDPKAGGNSQNIAHVVNELKVLDCDISDTESCLESVLNSDIIINCAAITSHITSMHYPHPNLTVNCISVLNILEILRERKLNTCFIQIGTTTQFGRVSKTVANENHPQNPLDIYSAHKVLAEQYVKIYAENFGVNAYSIRLPNIYGPRAAINTPALSFNNFFIGLALQDKAIPIYGDGKQLRNIVFIDDAVEAILLTIAEKNIAGQTFLATSDKYISVHNFAKKIVDVFGTGFVHHVDWDNASKKIEVGDANYSSQKLKKLTGWSPKTDLVTGLQLTHDYYEFKHEFYLPKIVK